MKNYWERRHYADLYLPTQVKILSNIFKCSKDDFRLASLKEDYNGVDIYFRNQIGIALRVRGEKYAKDLCLRMLQNSSGQSEMTILLGEHMDYILNCVGKSTKEPGKLSKYFLIDAHRLAKIARQHFQGVETEEKKGTDMYGTPYHFLAIDIDSLCEKMDDILVASGKIETVEPEPFFYKKYMEFQK